MENGFQILDKDGNPISINNLDKEVCEIVGNEQDKKYYCTLGRREDYKDEFDYITKTTNWYDSIGWMIAFEGKTFQQIIEYYTNAMKEFIGKEDSTGQMITIEMIYPYHMKVLNNWIDKGYATKQVICE